MGEDSLIKLTQAQWFELGEAYYNGATLEKCAVEWKVTIDDIEQNLTNITGIEIRPPVKEKIDYSKPEYEVSETLTHQSEGYASGRAPHDPPEEPIKQPRRIIKV
jgi:hypothetical protein